MALLVKILAVVSLGSELRVSTVNTRTSFKEPFQLGSLSVMYGQT